jgi:Family of unknown function (DUF5681)
MKTQKKRSPANRRSAGGDGHPIVELGKGTRFQPGQSGNPNGKPKWRLLSDTYRAKLAELLPGDKLGRNYAEAITDAVFAAALRGNIGAFQEIADRTEGKPAQAIALSGDLRVDMTVQEIDARLKDRNIHLRGGITEQAMTDVASSLKLDAVGRDLGKGSQYIQ